MLGALASGAGGLTPWGAAAGAIGQVASTPTSATSTTGPVNIGGLDMGPSNASQIQTTVLIGVALLAVVLVATRGRRG